MEGISVLLPTRRRLSDLRRAVDSLRRTAEGRVEVLLRVDTDDAADYEAIGRVLTGPRWGYRSIFRYYNELAALAGCRILLLWNDDMQMLTDRWDRKLAERVDPCIQFLQRDTYEGTHVDSAYPAVDERIFRAMGHISLNCHCDSWLYEVGRMAGVNVLRPDVRIHHDWRDGDETARERENDTEGFADTAMAEARRVDAERVRACL